MQRTRTTFTSSTKTKFTLSQLAQIALGAQNLTNDNIHILHTLVDIILKKLGCQDEPVYIGGIDATCMEKIFRDAKTSPIPVIDQEVDILTERIEALECWEQRIKILETKLECHFQSIKNQYAAREDEKWMGRFWEFYSLPVEDLCTTCEPENEIACSLLRNKFFLMKLLRRIAFPMIERIFAIEKKVDELNKAFANFLKKMEEVFAKMALIDQIIIEVEKLRTEIQEHYQEFIATMEECQQMLDAKFDKVHIPALKKYLKEKFLEINGMIEALQKAKDCPRATGIIMEGIKCLSCLNDKVCADIEPAPYNPPDVIKPFKKQYCGCKQVNASDPSNMVPITPTLPKGIVKKPVKREFQFTCGGKGGGKPKFFKDMDDKWIDSNLKKKNMMD